MLTHHTSLHASSRLLRFLVFTSQNQARTPRIFSSTQTYIAAETSIIFCSYDRPQHHHHHHHLSPSSNDSPSRQTDRRTRPDLQTEQRVPAAYLISNNRHGGTHPPTNTQTGCISVSPGTTPLLGAATVQLLWRPARPPDAAIMLLFARMRSASTITRSSAAPSAVRTWPGCHVT